MKDEVLGVLYTSENFDHAHLEKISVCFGLWLGTIVHFKIVVDSSLQGGFVAKIGERTYDASLRGKISNQNDSSFYSAREQRIRWSSISDLARASLYSEEKTMKNVDDEKRRLCLEEYNDRALRTSEKMVLYMVDELNVMEKIPEELIVYYAGGLLNYVNSRCEKQLLNIDFTCEINEMERMVLETMIKEYDIMFEKEFMDGMKN